MSGTNTPMINGRPVYGVVAEFDTPEALVHAGQEVHHRHGYKKLDALSPFPVHGIDEAIGVPRSILGYIVFCAGTLGAAAALLLIWWTSAVDYPLVIGGKPLFSVVFSVPITFELTVLFSAFAAVFGMFHLNRLPTYYHPVFNFRNFPDVTNDKFLLLVEASDPKFDVVRTQQLLESLGAKVTEVVEE